MKFRKFGKALLMGALSLGAVFSVTSCVQSYTVGFLYVTGVETAGTTGQGYITGFKIDHNTGQLSKIHTMPIGSGGAYPVRALLLSGSRFVYVLNQGGANCTFASPCTKANITQFAVGGEGSLVSQQVFGSAGYNPFRLLSDGTGGFIYVLDHDAPDSDPSGASTTNSCYLVLHTSTCGDITAFKVDGSTGRLSLILNAQQTSATGQPLAYFPVPANPIDFATSGGNVLTLSGTPSTGDEVFPYTYNSATGQLSISQNGVQQLQISHATALQITGSQAFILDNEPIAGTSSPSGIYAYSVGTGGVLQAAQGSPYQNVPNQSNPVFVLIEAKNTFAYAANAGNLTDPNNALSGIGQFTIDTSSKQWQINGPGFGSGAGPQCLVEDPSNQYIYTANYDSSNVTGGLIQQQSGTLSTLPGNAGKLNYSVPGPATYCLVNGRTS